MHLLRKRFARVLIKVAFYCITFFLLSRCIKNFQFLDITLSDIQIVLFRIGKFHLSVSHSHSFKLSLSQSHVPSILQITVSLSVIIIHHRTLLDSQVMFCLFFTIILLVFRRCNFFVFFVISFFFFRFKFKSATIVLQVYSV